MIKNLDENRVFSFKISEHINTATGQIWRDEFKNGNNFGKVKIFLKIDGSKMFETIFFFGFSTMLNDLPHAR